jgi:AcrR family transcriptional regulator
LDAAAEVIQERGYDAATMTEIAARASTAIGSLYRFFPTKEAVGDALITTYGEALFSVLDALETDGVTGEQLADRLVDLMVERRHARASAMTLFGAGSKFAGLRAKMRAGTRQRMAAIFTRLYPDISEARAKTRGDMLLAILKGIPQMAEEDEHSALGLIIEARRVVLLYLLEQN